MNRSGRSVAEASRVIEIDEVLEASSVPLPRCGASAAKIDFLISSSSVAASMTRSAAPICWQALDGLDAAERRLHRRSSMMPRATWRDMLCSMTLQAGVDPLAADVVQHDLVAGQGADMGDARAHLARADDADRS